MENGGPSRAHPRDETTATPILEMPEFQTVVHAAETPRQAVVPALIHTLAGRATPCCTAQMHHLKSHEENWQLGLRRKGGKGRVRPLPDRLSELIDAAAAGQPEGPIPAPTTPLADRLVWRPLQDAPLAWLTSHVGTESAQRGDRRVRGSSFRAPVAAGHHIADTASNG
ncbi:hypothetical protein [Streptomyces sp. NPDC055134]